MELLQAFRRFGQQFTGWSESFKSQECQSELIKKLYAKKGLEIIMTCGACPEQYDILKDGKQVAYYRLRHGEFRVDSPDCGDETIYVAFPNGDGIFDDDERLVYLSNALRHVLQNINN